MKQYSWSEIYHVALLELDSSKLPERLALAREKLKQRMQLAGLSADEQQAIVDALNNLHVIELNEGSRSQSAGRSTQEDNPRGVA
jgi:hypothetical protein